ncbi:hypothetical protein AVEN_183973-1 [Araneus ventricosus]|uniref:Uncharacterized protein n=1 Tax=Araneus ventricosus TaxID=182803 RepID=A0A4Y2E095_ARAVE|nr:hypothetical protein AVEN_183973-1 [Araneus ventricosus]
MAESPPNRMILPPKGSLHFVRSCKSLSTAKKAWTCVMGASSHTINFVLSNVSASFVLGFKLQVDVAFKSIGILKTEWAVLPHINRAAAIPVDTTGIKSSPLPRIVQHSTLYAQGLLPVRTSREALVSKVGLGGAKDCHRKSNVPLNVYFPQRHDVLREVGDISEIAEAGGFIDTDHGMEARLRFKGSFS